MIILKFWQTSLIFSACCKICRPGLQNSRWLCCQLHALQNSQGMCILDGHWRPQWICQYILEDPSYKQMEISFYKQHIRFGHVWLPGGGQSRTMHDQTSHSASAVVVMKMVYHSWAISWCASAVRFMLGLRSVCQRNFQLDYIHKSGT